MNNIGSNSDAGNPNYINPGAALSAGFAASETNDNSFFKGDYAMVQPVNNRADLARPTIPPTPRPTPPPVKKPTCGHVVVRPSPMTSQGKSLLLLQTDQLLEFSSLKY